VFRKSMLNQAALDLKADALAIGHNADDVAQTFLMNFMHNDSNARERLQTARQDAFEAADSPQASQPRNPGFVPRIKPLIYNLEKECALYCEINNLPYYRGNCPYAGESFRGDVKDFLNELENRQPGVKFNLVQSFIGLQKNKDKKIRGNEAGDNKAEGGEPKENSLKGGKTKFTKCRDCGQNSSQETCQACQFVEELS
jgi:uncharacterized protein (TIGR00269 family)